jgi:hypothetical protein
MESMFYFRIRGVGWGGGGGGSTPVLAPEGTNPEQGFSVVHPGTPMSLILSCWSYTSLSLPEQNEYFIFDAHRNNPVDEMFQSMLHGCNQICYVVA